MKWNHWKHKRNGKSYVVEQNTDGVVVGICGPLEWSKLRKILMHPEKGAFLRDFEVIAWWNENQDEFEIDEEL